MKNKGIVVFVILLLIAAIIKFAYNTFMRNNYTIILNEDTRFDWLFKDSVIKSLKCIYAVGNENGSIYAYHLNKQARIVIWHTSDYDSVHLNEIDFNYKVDIPQNALSIKSIGPLYADPELDVIRKVSLDPQNSISVDIETGSQLSKIIDSSKFRMVFGEINRIGIRGTNGGYQLIFSHKRNIPVTTELIVFQNACGFFLIYIDELEHQNLDFNLYRLFTFCDLCE